MRTSFVIALAAALAALPALAVAAPPRATCEDPCTIAASQVGFTPAVVTIASGTRVAWISTDFGHANADGLAPSEACFFADYDAHTASEPARFDVTLGALTSTQAGVTTTCANAVSVAGVGFVLPYYCVIHPTMRGSIVVAT